MFLLADTEDILPSNTLTCVTGINVHSFEALVRLERRAGPFPNAT